MVAVCVLGAARVGVRQIGGETALHKACWGGSVNAVAALLVAGADVNAMKVSRVWHEWHGWVVWVVCSCGPVWAVDGVGECVDRGVWRDCGVICVSLSVCVR